MAGVWTNGEADSREHLSWFTVVPSFKFVHEKKTSGVRTNGETDSCAQLISLLLHQLHTLSKEKDNVRCVGQC